MITYIITYVDCISIGRGLGVCSRGIHYHYVDSKVFQRVMENRREGRTRGRPYPIFRSGPTIRASLVPPVRVISPKQGLRLPSEYSYLREDGVSLAQDVCSKTFVRRKYKEKYRVRY
jgi:hypothetical protein